ncbi:MAG: MBL fold metallo-hydrolase [Erysipelothrix sp.]
MKIEVLLENEAIDKRVKPKHGLSILVKTNGKTILFDTGPDKTYLENAQKLEVQLDCIDSIVISHGHIDHLGGLKYFPKINNLEKVVLAETAFDKYWIKLGPFYKNIGVNKVKYSNVVEKFCFISNNYRLYDNVYVLMCKNIKECESVSIMSSNLFEGDLKNPDDFHHELIMVIKEDGKLFVFTGCSHSGILNIIKLVEKNFDEPIKAIIGGFHLIGLPYLNTLSASKKEIEILADRLLSKKVETYYSCHCTGPKAFEIMYPIMKGRLISIKTGSQILI